jgi:hypothetical protein
LTLYTSAISPPSALTSTATWVLHREDAETDSLLLLQSGSLIGFIHCVYTGPDNANKNPDYIMGVQQQSIQVVAAMPSVTAANHQWRVQKKSYQQSSHTHNDLIDSGDEKEGGALTDDGYLPDAETTEEDKPNPSKISVTVGSGDTSGGSLSVRRRGPRRSERKKMDVILAKFASNTKSSSEHMSQLHSQYTKLSQDRVLAENAGFRFGSNGNPKRNPASKQKRLSTRLSSKPIPCMC